MQRDHRQRDEKQRAMPQGLGQGIGGSEDFALPGTGQTQPREMGAGFPGGPPIGSPGAAEQRAKIHAEQIAQPTPLKGAPPLTPTKIPPGTGGVKPAPPPASTPPPPGQIGAQPQAPTGQIPLTGPTELGAPASDPAWAPGGRWGSPPGQPTPPQAPTPPQQQVPPQEPMEITQEEPPSWPPDPLNAMKDFGGAQLGGGAPEGFIPPPPGSMNTMAMVPYYNPETGETYTASSGGWTPPAGWRQGSPDDERRSGIPGLESRLPPDIQDRLRALLEGGQNQPRGDFGPLLIRL